MLCLLCKKHNTANLKNNSKVYNLIPAQCLKTDDLKDQLKKCSACSSCSGRGAQPSVNFSQRSRGTRHLCRYTGWLKKFLPLLQMLGLVNMKHFRHRSSGSTIKIFLTLVRVLKQRVVEALRKSKAFGLLVDEETDIHGTVDRFCSACL